MENRPQGRKKTTVGGSANVNKRGQGLGTGPVGKGVNGKKPQGGGDKGLGSDLIGGLIGGALGGSSSSGSSSSSHGSSHGSSGGLGSSLLGLLGGGSSSGSSHSSSHSSGSSGKKGSGLSKIIGIVIFIVVAYFILKYFGIIGNGSGCAAGTNVSGGASGGSILGSIGSLFQTDGINSLRSSLGGSSAPKEGSLNTKVSSKARNKYTTIRGNGKDVFTIMVYMCGTDLESGSGMASADLQEMLNADVNEKINLIVYTGGCKKWKNNVISSTKNQIYQIKNKNLYCLEDDMGTGAMVDPATLSEFIKYGKKNFEADRYALIFWDHGGGSLSGYGYDEKNSGKGSMTLSGIDKALKDGGLKYDFIGFDACLMATLENGLMLSDYGDYMIASEETEPGIGWYYTNWLTKLSANTSMATVEIGKNIVDDFVEQCYKSCNGQLTTLSVTDLAELEKTMPDSLKNFAAGTSKLIKNNEYQKVSEARSNTREFATSSKIDQIDLMHLAQNLGTDEGRDLEKIIKSAVKYNRTSGNMTNANGLSIYFPYKKMSKVDSAVDQYEKIGMDDEYMRCITEFASIEASGQSAASAGGSLFGGSGSSSGGSLLGDLIGGFLGGGGGFDLSGLGFLSGKSLQNDYVDANSIDISDLKWTNDNGTNKLVLSEEQWKLINSIELNVFVNDGSGYIDLGLDNVFEFDDNGSLIGEYDGTWLSINGQPVAYYAIDEISGYVPCLLNGERKELIIMFDENNPAGYIAGARAVYVNGETETVAKSLTALQKGDTLDFLCDYYGYDGTYQDSYKLGDRMVLGDSVIIGNIALENEDLQATYKITDIYGTGWWMYVE